MGEVVARSRDCNLVGVGLLSAFLRDNDCRWPPRSANKLGVAMASRAASLLRARNDYALYLLAQSVSLAAGTTMDSR